MTTTHTNYTALYWAFALGGLLWTIIWTWVWFMAFRVLRWVYLEKKVTKGRPPFQQWNPPPPPAPVPSWTP